MDKQEKQLVIKLLQEWEYYYKSLIFGHSISLDNDLAILKRKKKKWQEELDLSEDG